jgi:hypothetical protein
MTKRKKNPVDKALTKMNNIERAIFNVSTWAEELVDMVDQINSELIELKETVKKRNVK